MSTEAMKLPQLPPPDRGTVRVGRDDISCGHSDEGMLAYGKACAAAALAQQADEPVANECLRLADAIDPLTRKGLDNLTCTVVAKLLRSIAAPAAPAAQRADEPVTWRSEEDTPPAPGWYAVRRAAGSLCLRGFGKDGLWWIPLQDGWLSGIPPGFSWFGPLEPIEWGTPAAPAAPAYVPLTDAQLDEIESLALARMGEGK